LNVIGQPVCWLTIITRWQAHTRSRCHMRCLPLTPLSPASSDRHIELLLIAKSWLLTPTVLFGRRTMRATLASDRWTRDARVCRACATLVCSTDRACCASSCRANCWPAHPHPHMTDMSTAAFCRVSVPPTLSVYHRHGEQMGVLCVEICRWMWSAPWSPVYSPPRQDIISSCCSSPIPAC
jgi:hypothetical protein